MNRTGHPTDGDLLRYADGEVSARKAKDIQLHLAACWECRTELAELERTISDCVRYRQTVLRDGLPDPPAPWFDIQRRFAELDELHERSWSRRLWDSLRATAVRPRRWAPVMAVIVVAVLLVDQFRNAPSVQAAELLQKAVVAAKSRPKAPRRIQFRTSAHRVTRVLNAAAGLALSPEDMATLAALQLRFQKANYSFDDPLSVASFAAWREALPEKHDEVTKIQDAKSPEQSCYRIRTTTNSGELADATLRLTLDTLRPVEGTFRFRDREWVEISEVEPSPVPATLARIPDVSTRPSPEAVEPSRSREIVKPASLGEELQVLAVLHRLRADLGEPVEVRREGGQVVVSGVGVTPGLREQIDEELAGMPRVAVQFSDPEPEGLPAPGRSLRNVTLRPEIARLQAEIQKQIGGRAAFEQFTDELLAVSDDLMSRVHALRRLAERFQPEAESQLDANERRLLSRLRREHAVAVAGLAATLEQRARPVFVSLGASVEPPTLPTHSPAAWQAATEELFGEARRTESLLAAMLGGAAIDAPPEELPARTLSSILLLRAEAAEYVRNALE